MTERIIELEGINLEEFWGLKNIHLELLKSYYPKIKIVTRGSFVKIFGEKTLLDTFETRFKRLILHYSRYNGIDENVLIRIMQSEAEADIKPQEIDKILVHGIGGKLIKPLTPNQQKLVELVQKNDMVFAIGPAGTGKTYTGVALAVKALKNKEVKSIILTRPAVEAGENLGFLPGDMKEKLDPYMQPLYDALRDMLPPEKLEDYLLKSIIQIAPLAFMRGRTLDNAFVILDEAQNTTHSQMKMFLTRMGKNSKFMITGDPTQIDLPRNTKSGLKEAIALLKDVNGISILFLDDKDVVRHRLVRKIIEAYKTIEINSLLTD